jgi:hypothetical protein
MWEIIAVAIVILLVWLIYWKAPSSPVPVPFEGFANLLSSQSNQSECVRRSREAQNLLDRIAATSSETAQELRLLVTKICCMEADIVSPIPGTYRTLQLQFRTSDDIEPPATLVGRCLQKAMNARDIELIAEKFRVRGDSLIHELNLPSIADSEMDAIVTQLQNTMSACIIKPQMDIPTGVRDMGFWEPDSVSELNTY